MDQIIQIAMMTSMFFFDHLLELAITAGVAFIHRWTGIQIEACHREALHSALSSGVRMALEKGKTGSGLKSHTLNYVKHSVPAALKHFGIENSSLLHSMIEAKINEIVGNVDSDTLRPK